METKQQPTPERASEIKESFFHRRTIFSTVISLIITLVGAIAISVLPIEQYPNLTPPQVEVSATYTGASAEVIAETEASLHESQINGDDNMIAASKTFIDFIAADPDQVKDSVLASTYFPVRTSVGDIYAGNEVMSEYSKFMGYLGDYYQITPGWTTARTEWWNMLQRVGSGEDVESAVKTFVDNANAAAQA